MGSEVLALPRALEGGEIAVSLQATAVHWVPGPCSADEVLALPCAWSLAYEFVDGHGRFVATGLDEAAAVVVVRGVPLSEDGERYGFAEHGVSRETRELQHRAASAAGLARWSWQLCGRGRFPRGNGPRQRGPAPRAYTGDTGRCRGVAATPPTALPKPGAARPPYTIGPLEHDALRVLVGKADDSGRGRIYNRGLSVWAGRLGRLRPRLLVAMPEWLGSRPLREYVLWPEAAQCLADLEGQNARQADR